MSYSKLKKPASNKYKEISNTRNKNLKSSTPRSKSNTARKVGKCRTPKKREMENLTSNPRKMDSLSNIMASARRFALLQTSRQIKD